MTTDVRTDLVGPAPVESPDPVEIAKFVLGASQDGEQHRPNGVLALLG